MLLGFELCGYNDDEAGRASLNAFVEDKADDTLSDVELSPTEIRKSVGSMVELGSPRRGATAYAPLVIRADAKRPTNVSIDALLETVSHVTGLDKRAITSRSDLGLLGVAVAAALGITSQSAAELARRANDETRLLAKKVVNLMSLGNE